jgi:ubiquinol-cytochrome c reductase cytochrome b subunit
MAEGFMGYVLPWGQMSYWGSQVIINLFGAIPVVGSGLSELIRGDFVVGDATLNRFFSFHVIAIPLVLLGLVVAHLLALHDVGSNNPDGIEIKAGPKGNRWSPDAPADGIPFHPYYTVHDILFVCVFLVVFFAVVFFAPEGGGYFLETNNFIPANPMAAPSHVAPVWYFTAFYAMLRAVNDMMVNVLVVILAVATVWTLLKSKWSIKGKVVLVVVALVLGYFLKTLDAKFWGVVVMGLAVITLFFLPWLDRSPVKSIRYRPGWHKGLYALFVVSFAILMWLGIALPGPLSANPTLAWFTNEFVSMILALVYFGFFWLMPWWSQKGQFKQPPARVNYTPHAH